MLTQGVGASVVLLEAPVPVELASARRAILSLGNAATREAEAAARRTSGKTEVIIMRREIRDFVFLNKQKCKNVGGEKQKNVKPASVK